jgi:hypothetical protein
MWNLIRLDDGGTELGNEVCAAALQSLNMHVT